MAYSGNYLPTFWDNLSVPFSREGKGMILEDGNDSCPEMSVKNYYILHNIPDESRSHVLQGRSLKSRKLLSCRLLEGTLMVLSRNHFPS